MTTKTRLTAPYLIAVIALAGGLFFVDILVPLGLAVWLGYVGVILLSLWFPDRWLTYVTAVGCSSLMVLGFFFPFKNEDLFWIAAVNRSLGTLTLWIVALVGLAARGNRHLQKANRQLQQEISERKRVEDQLREQATLLNLAHDAITVRDLDNRILFWNEGAQRLFGWTATEVLGENAIDLLFPANTRGPVEEAKRQLLVTGNWTGEFRQVTKSGQEIVAETRWTLVQDEEGHPRSILAVNTDATEKNTLQAQLLRTQRLESIGVLTGGIAHDFNNLLTPILMTVKLLREERPESERQHLLSTLQASAERGAEMVKQLLSFAGGGDGQQTVVQLKHVVHEVKAILDCTFPKNIEIELALEDNLWPVRGDATQLSQLLMNLCVNARDAMASGGKLTVRVENMKLSKNLCQFNSDAWLGPYIVISVDDSGCGIPPEVADRVFDPFFTTKEQGKGTGLGLSMVLGIVKSHRGFIDFSSRTSEGTHFGVYLPAKITEMVQDVRQESKAVAMGRGDLVLVVDDEPHILETIKVTLESHGYRVFTAGDGNEALAVYQQRQEEIQAVVLDMMMPGVDGVTVMEELKKRNGRIPIIASSGLPAKGRVAEAMAVNKTPFLLKPYSDEQILLTLANVLGRAG